MPVLITLTEDGPLGKAGQQVWVNDPDDADKPKASPAKKAPAKKAPEK